MMTFATSNSRGSKSLFTFLRLLAPVLVLAAVSSQLVAQSPPPASFSTSSLFGAASSQDAVHQLAAGDLNNDGHQDLVVAGWAGDVNVLLGNGDGTFRWTYDYPLFGAQAVVLGDFNGDGNLDAAVLDFDPNGTDTSVAIYLGDGSGNLNFKNSYAVGNHGGGGDAYNNIATADLNGDHNLDLVTVNNYDGTVSVLFGNGDGTFQPQVVYNIGTTDDWVAIADVNHDGNPDLVVSCYAGCPPSNAGGGFSVLLNNGNGTFQTPVFYGGAPQGVNGLAIADLNGDGNLDVAVVEDGPWNGAAVFLGKGDGTFQAPVSYYAPYASSIAIADLNGDGKPDLVVTDWSDSSTWVLLGNGDGTFQPGVAYATDWQPQGLVLADFNGDGNLDFAVGSQRGSFVTVALGSGDGTFRAGTNYGLTQRQVNMIAVADFNGDGNLDIVQAGGVPANNAVTVMLGSSHGVLGAPIATPALCSMPYWVDAGDVNGDGKPDIVAAPECYGEVAVLLGNGDGTFESPVYYSTGDGSSYQNVVKLADVNGDGKLDMLISNSDGSLSVLLNEGAGTFGTATVIQGVTGVGTYILTGDFNGDGKLDLALPDYVNNAVKILLGNGDGTFQTPISVTGGGAISRPNGLTVGDFNHDGKLDLAVPSSTYNGGGGGVAILLGNGDGTFTFSAIYGWELGSLGQGAPGTQPADLTSADVNGDGNLDLLIPLVNTHIWTSCNCGREAGNDGLVVLLGNGDGTFVNDPAGPFITGSYQSQVVTGDFNNDGAIDAAVLSAQYGVAPYVTLLLNAAGGVSRTTTTALSSSLNPSSYGESVTFTAKVTPQGSGTPTGSVTFTDGANTLGTVALSGGTAKLTTASLPTGPNSIGASYSGDSNFNPSSATLSQTVNQASTTLALGSSTNPSSFGQSVTFTATITPQYGGVATGTVTFTDGANTLGSVSVSGNMASLSTSALAVGSHSISASYSGDSNFNSSSASLTQTVNQESSSVALTSSGSPTIYGQNVTFTATITPQYGGVATGTVTFKDGGTPLGTVSVAGNAASFSTTTLGAGTHSITATYSGNSNVAGSTSLPISQVVNKSATTTTLTSSENPSYVGQSVTITATVIGQQGGAVTGSVAFKQGAKTLATVALLNGQAAYTTASLTAGTHVITAVYSGDSNNSASTSATLKQVVDSLPAATTTVVATSGSPSFINQLVTFTATITSAYGPIPDGETVTFYDGATAIGTGPTASGVATFQTSSLTAKTHTIKATYSGDATFKSSSGKVTQVVNLYPSTTTVTSSPNPSTYGQAVELVATVSSSAPGGPTGTVTFKNSATTLGTATLSGGKAVLSTTKLPVGTLTITATYSGDAQSGKSSGTTTQTVNQATTTTSVSSSVNPSRVGHAVKFTATVTSPTTTPTGTVTFTDGSTVLGTGTLAGGKTSYSTSTLSAGSHNIAAVYNGTANIGGSTSPVLVQTVN